jgi:gamma-glutamyltranspeptidase/glutathione hydrolase
MSMRSRRAALAAAAVLLVIPFALARPQKPAIMARHWLAITGKPLAATAGAHVFEHGGNAVDAACAMLAATCTMWDTLAWGGETQALIFNPKTHKVMALNALGVAPTGASADFYKGKNLRYPPEFGPLAAITPGTPGGLMVMEAEWGKLSLAEVLQPAIDMAGDGYPIEQELVHVIASQQARLSEWSFSKAVLLPDGKPPETGAIFRQSDLAATLKRLVEAEKAAKAKGADRKAAILAAYDLFYKGAMAHEFEAAAKQVGALITADDLGRWKPKIEEPVTTSYHGIDVYKLNVWTQGPAMLQALNLLEPEDLKGMGYNSARYIHTVTQAMQMAFADRDFYYGDPDFPPEEPVKGLLSKDYARKRWAAFDPNRNPPETKPGDPYPFQGAVNPVKDLLDAWPPPVPKDATAQVMTADEAFRAGTTSIEAADAEGWVVSVTPSGAWVPAVIAGKTGIGLSQRAQSFVLDRRENPFNVMEPGKRPRVTLTPSLALKDGKPFLAFAVQGGDTQDQNLLQFFLNVVDFGMDVQESAEAANVTTYQMHSSFGAHEIRAGRLTLDTRTPDWVRDALRGYGYTLDFAERNSGPINAIYFDQAHGTMRGGSSNNGDDYGIGW